MKNNPTVSILCLTFNQALFVKQMLDSLISQKTNFEVEILIYDDASSDGTAKIIKEYELKYPDLIRAIYQQENQFSRGVKGVLNKYLLPIAKGKYISLCEGDDFFTDINKLQTQVDFLDKHPTYNICFHPARVFFENNEEADSLYPDYTKLKKFTLLQLVHENFIITNSVLYRKRNYINLPTNIWPGDWYLHIFHAQNGKIGYINKVMSAYRRHSKGLWWNSYLNPIKFNNNLGYDHIRFYLEVLAMVGQDSECKNIVLSRIENLTSQYIESHRHDTILNSNLSGFIRAFLQRLRLTHSHAFHHFSASKNDILSQ